MVIVCGFDRAQHTAGHQIGDMLGGRDDALANSTGLAMNPNGGQHFIGCIAHDFSCLHPADTALSRRPGTMACARMVMSA
ncbi:hypothetical protein AQ766_08695 [Burkholderia pseudomallei]|nr:hypothetical protein AQ766_08695 [Burkholderia pseudomallei]